MITSMLAAYSLYGLWAVSWFAAAAWTRRTIGRPQFGSQAFYTLILLVGITLLMSARRGATQISPLRFPLDWFCVAGMGVGFAFCWWARIHLGSLWSGTVTAKEGHHVIDTGPYRMVRHPIYTGLGLASIFLAVLKLAPQAFAGAALIILSFWIKARMEEGILRETLGAEAYDSYAARTPMLVPFWPK